MDIRTSNAGVMLQQLLLFIFFDWHFGGTIPADNSRTNASNTRQYYEDSKIIPLQSKVVHISVKAVMLYVHQVMVYIQPMRCKKQTSPLHPNHFVCALQFGGITTLLLKETQNKQRKLTSPIQIFEVSYERSNNVSTLSRIVPCGQGITSGIEHTSYLADENSFIKIAFKP